MQQTQLWRFAVTLWRDRGIERACLRLQDECAVPVAAVLVALWAATSGRRPDAALGRRILITAEQFEGEYLRPLREVRRRAAAGQGTGELKRQIQEAELEGERLLLQQLGALAGAAPASGEAQSTLGWLLVVVPDAARCEALQALLNELSENPALSG